MYSSSNSSSFLPADEHNRRESPSPLYSPSSSEPAVGCWSRSRALTDIPVKVSPHVKDELVALTNLTPNVIELLYSRFRLLARNGFMSYNCFKRSLGLMALLDETFLPERLFAAFDVRADGALDFVEWCASLGIMMKGSEDERLEFSFRLLRPPGKGILRKGNSLIGPMWRGVQSKENYHGRQQAQSRKAVWNAVYSHATTKSKPYQQTQKTTDQQAPERSGEPASAIYLSAEDPANSSKPRKGSRNWVTYLLATDPADPSNVITLDDFIYIVRSLENTRSQLTTDLSLGKQSDAVIQDVFSRACQLAPEYRNSRSNVLTAELTLENYKLAVTHMPEFLELLGIPTWSNAGIATSPDESMMYKTPKSTRRLLSDPGRDTNDINVQSIEILNTVKTDLLKLVRLINHAGTENMSLHALLPIRPLAKSQSLAVSQSVHASHKTPSRESSMGGLDVANLTTPVETGSVFYREALHGSARPNVDCMNFCEDPLSQHRPTCSRRENSILRWNQRCGPAANPMDLCMARRSSAVMPEMMLSDSASRLQKALQPLTSPLLVELPPSGQGVRRIAQASDPRMTRGLQLVQDGGRLLQNRKSTLRLGYDTMKPSVHEPSGLSSLSQWSSSISLFQQDPLHCQPPPTRASEDFPLGSRGILSSGSSTPDEEPLWADSDRRIVVKSAVDPPEVSNEGRDDNSLTSGSVTPTMVNLISRSESIQMRGMSDEDVRRMAFTLIDWIDNMTGESPSTHHERRERMFVNATNFSVFKKNDNALVRGKLPRHRPRRRRVETKILDVGGRKGLVVHFGHRSWNLVLNMMLGIRMAAYRCHTNEGNIEHTIGSYDFLIKENFCVLPRVANIIDKIRRYDYEIVRFIDYAPMVFRKLRDLDQLNAADYLDSVGPEKLLNNIVLGNLSSLSELYTEGKSGAIFYYSNDGRFIVKTIDRAAAKLFKTRIMSSYYEHLQKHQNSLVIRIYGFHALKIQMRDGFSRSRTSSVGGVGTGVGGVSGVGGGSTGVGGGGGGIFSRKSRVKKLYFIVMKNIFHTNCIIHRRYDLKGSWIGRTTITSSELPPLQKTAPSVAAPEERDVLQSSKIWNPTSPDSPLASQSVFKHPSPALPIPPEWWDPTISLKDLDILKLGDHVVLEHNKRDELLSILEADSLWLSKLHLIDYSLLIGIHVNGINDNYVIPPQVPIRHVAHHDPKSELYSNAVMSKDKKCQYFFGVVDILTTYNNAKRFEHVCKSITNDHNGISCVKPTKYQDRFQKFMKTVFT